MTEALVSKARLIGNEKIFVLAVMYALGLLLLFINIEESRQNTWVFIALYFLTFAVAPPRHAISPLSIFYLYYGLWFVLAPIFAERYEGDVLLADEFARAFFYSYAVFGMGVISVVQGEKFGYRSTRRMRVDLRSAVPSGSIVLCLLYVAATLMVFGVVLSSGGFGVWISDPGDAFLNRAGSGVYVVLSHFISIALAALSGYFAYSTRRIGLLWLFFSWVLVTSPVHGSKFQISLLIVVALIPWLRELRFFSRGTLFLGVALVLVFFLGLYFRNLSWIEFETMLPYALNYFTALDNLAISIRDFSPSLLETFFLPFNKLLTPLGLDPQVPYYDMNHLLTDIYFPHAWEIRATEQWPVETDLYLNFYFYLGLPFVGAFLFGIGWIYGGARRVDSLGWWFAAIVLTLFMVSHLRGSLINHTDFYMYPYVVLMWFLFRKYGFKFIATCPRYE